MTSARDVSRRLLVCAAVLGTAVALACGTTGRRGDPFAGSGSGPAGGSDEPGLVVNVQNRNFADATVHILSGGRRTRVGTTPSNSNRSFSIEWPGGPRQVQAEIDLFGGGNYTTAAVPSAPGDRITVVIQPQLTQSYIRP